MHGESTSIGQSRCHFLGNGAILNTGLLFSAEVLIIREITAKSAWVFFSVLLLLSNPVLVRAQSAYERGVKKALDVILASALSVCKSIEQNESQGKWLEYYSDLLEVDNDARRAFLSLPEETQNKRVNEVIWFHFGSCEEMLDEVRIKGLGAFRSDFASKRLSIIRQQKRR